MRREDSIIRVRGDIEITVRDRAGRVQGRVDVRNKIVGAGLLALPRLLAQAETEELTDWKLAYLGVGQGTAVASALDTSLQNEITAGRVTLGYANLDMSTAGQLRINVRIPDTVSGSNAPYQITEAGLFLGNGTLFARQVFNPIQTAPGLQLDYAWTITFTA